MILESSSGSYNCTLSSGLSNYLPAPETRYLSTANVQLARPVLEGSTNDIRLFFENRNGNLTALYASWEDSSDDYTFTWNDTSMDLYNSAPGVKLGVPFSSSTYIDTQSNVPIPELTFPKTAITVGRAGAFTYGCIMATSFAEPQPGSNGYFTGTAQDVLLVSLSILIISLDLNTVHNAQSHSSFLNQSIEQSDIAAMPGFVVFVQKSELSFLWIGGLDTAPMPRSSFPFTRLAKAFSVNDSTVTFLYHQLDTSTFAEEQWDTSIGDWLPTTNISI